jgi:cation:H+ antiporter
MLLALGLLLAGAAVLYVGAEASVRGAAGLARAVGVPAFVLGALLFGLDLEGLGAGLIAAARGETALAAGQIFGSVLFVFSAAFGAALVVSRRPVPSPEPIMVLAPAAHLLGGAWAISDRYVGRLEGAFLVALYAAYVGLVLIQGRLPRAATEELEREAAESPRSRALLAGMTAGGLLLLVGGAAVLVSGGSRLAAETGLATGFVGAAILGVLVSLDEVLLEVLPIRRGTPELATGNLFGTLAAFTAGVLGLAALVRPLEVDGAGSLAYLAVAFLYACVATVFLARGRAGWGLGLFVLACYGVWLVGTSGA